MSKTKPIPVHIYFLLDRTGSMASIQADVIGGFNRFLEEQKSQPGKCRFTLVQFDSQNPQEVLYDATPIAEVAPLTTTTFIPRGMTPLLDAEGRLIARARDREAARQAAKKSDEAVLFVTYTDGMENASTEWTADRLREAKKLAEESGWAFQYLGVGHDAYGQAASVGTPVASTLSVAANTSGVLRSYAGASHATNNVRSKALHGQRVASTNLMDGFEETPSKS